MASDLDRFLEGVSMALCIHRQNDLINPSALLVAKIAMQQRSVFCRTEGFALTEIWSQQGVTTAAADANDR